MRVVVTVPLPDAKTGEPRLVLTNLFEFFDLSADEGRPGATVRFGLPKKLRPILAPVQSLGPDQGRSGLRDDEQVCHGALRAGPASVRTGALC